MRKVFARNGWNFCLALVLISIAWLGLACTSSTSNVSTNPSYERDYTTPTRSRQAAGGGAGEFPQEAYTPPITLSLIAMKTNEVIPGETYPIVAVVDNPNNRDLTYRWSVEGGKLSTVPEGSRSELLKYLGELKANKGVEKKAEAPAQESQPAPSAGAGSAQAAAGVPKASRPAAVPPIPSAGGAGATSTTATSSPQTKEGEKVSAPSAAQEGASQAAASENENPEPSESNRSEDKGEGTSESGTSVENRSSSKPTTESAKYALYLPLVKYAVLAEEVSSEASDNPELDWPEPRPRDEAEKEADVSSSSEEVVAKEGTSGDEKSKASEEADEAEEQSARNIEGIVEDVSKEAQGFEGFQPAPGMGKLVEVEEKATEEVKGKEEKEEEVKLVRLETDEPFVLWTPETAGSYTIRLVVTDEKGNELTEERSLPVTVSEPKPRTTLVWNTSKKLNEDDFLVVEIRGQNLPAFYKGLFTLNYDPTVMSFRIAEIGSLFPQNKSNSIYYAEPPGNRGKVTIAISTDAVELPKGDGVIARAIFKVKEPVDNPSALQISEETAEEARYILDAEGRNILPSPRESPIFATEWIEPPERPKQSRQTQPTEGIPQTPAPPEGSRPPRPELGAPAAAGSTGTSASPSTGGPGASSSPTQVQPPVESGGSSVPPARTGQAPREILQRQLDDLRRQRDQVSNDPNMSEEQKQEALARLDEDIRRLEEQLAQS